MPQKPEHRFRTRVRKKLNKTIDVWSVHDSFSAGVPDCWYSGWQADLWAEYKYFPSTPASVDLTLPEKKPKLTRLQQYWLNRKYDQGRNCWVVVGFPDGAVILQDKQWMERFTVADNLITVDELARAIEAHCGVQP